MSQMTSNRTFVYALIAVVLASGIIVGTGLAAHPVTDHSQDTSYLRVVHAAPGGGAVDVYVDESPVLTDVTFSTVSDYLALEAGTHTVRVTPAGDNETTVLERNLTVDARSVSTLYASENVTENSTEAIDPVLFSDDAYTPGENDSAVSIVHLSPDAPPVDITADDGNVVLADNVSFQNASDYVTVPAGNYTVEIRAENEGNNGTVVTTADVALEGGEVYSAIALGYLDPTAEQEETPFEIIVTEDASKTISLPGPAPTETPTETETPSENETPTETESPTETEMPTETEPAT